MSSEELAARIERLERLFEEGAMDAGDTSRHDGDAHRFWSRIPLGAWLKISGPTFAVMALGFGLLWNAQQETTRRILDVQTETADRILVAQDETTDRILAFQDETTDRILAFQDETTDRILAFQKETTDRILALERSTTDRILDMQQQILDIQARMLDERS